jgi:hypothetical protein
LRPVVISPPSSTAPGQATAVTVRVLDCRSYAHVVAILHWRCAGTVHWHAVPMTRRVKAIFTGVVPAAGLVEYDFTVSEGDNTARFPVSGHLSCLTTGTPLAVPPITPAHAHTEGKRLCWDAVPRAFWYRIYRDGQLLTYVAGDTLAFTDGAPGFDGVPLAGTQAYRITAADKDGNESRPMSPLIIAY